MCFICFWRQFIFALAYNFIHSELIKRHLLRLSRSRILEEIMTKCNKRTTIKIICRIGKPNVPCIISKFLFFLFNRFLTGSHDAFFKRHTAWKEKKLVNKLNVDRVKVQHLKLELSLENMWSIASENEICLYFVSYSSLYSYIEYLSLRTILCW